MPIKRFSPARAGQERDVVTTQEFFDTYRDRFWRPTFPLVSLRQWYEEGVDTGAYRHEDFFALYVVQSGRGIHMINDYPYAIVPGDVYITPPGTVHRYCDYHRLRADAFCFQASLFAPDELDSLRALSGFWNLFIPTNMGGVAVSPHYQLHLSPDRHREVQLMVDALLSEIAQPAEIALPVLVRGLLFQLLVALARAQIAEQAAPVSSTGSGRGPSLADMIRVCEERCTEPLSVSRLAALLFLSPGHLSEIFSREMGMPPATYIRRLRLERAQTLLRTTTLSVTQIAQQTGFTDSAQFSRAFRSLVGMTPLTYRKVHNRA